MFLSMKRFVKLALTVTVTTVLGACGGGGGSSNEGNAEQADIRRPQAGLAIGKMPPGLTLLAGYAGAPGTLDGLGTSARFSYPVNIAIDPADNLYVTDNQANQSKLVLRRVTPDSMVTTLSAPAWQFNTIDQSGNRYMADRESVVRVASDGTISPLAGVSGSPGFVDGNGTNARLTDIRKIVVDQVGNVYAINSRWTCPNSKPVGCINEGGAIRKITPAGIVTTLAGSIGDGNATVLDGAGTAARFSDPYGLAVDGAGNLFVGDSGSIRKISATGEVTTLPKDPSVNLGRGITDLAVSKGNELFALAGGKLYKVAPTGAMTPLANFTIDIGLAQPFSDTALAGLVIDGAGTLFAASQTGAVYRVTPAGVVSTFAGMPARSGTVDGKGPLALFREAESIARDRDGNLYVIENLGRIRKISPDGTTTTLGSANGTFVNEAGAESSIFHPRGIAVAPDGTVYIGDFLTIRKLSKNGVLSTLAGSNQVFGDTDGVGASGTFSSIRSMVADNAGNLYVAEAHSVRKVSPGGAVTTLAGSSTGGSSDGKGAAAFFRFPSGIALDNAGNLLIADTDNATIRKLSPDGAVTTIAGSSSMRGLVDGVGSAARFNSPKDMAADEAGNVFVIDTGTVRKVTPAGVVTTIAGSSQFTGTRLGDLPGNFARLAGITYLGANVFAVSDGSSVLRLAVP
jgi:sugar lactone lactonase YvrE